MNVELQRFLARNDLQYYTDDLYDRLSKITFTPEEIKKKNINYRYYKLIPSDEKWVSDNMRYEKQTGYKFFRNKKIDNEVDFLLHIFHDKDPGKEFIENHNHEAYDIYKFEKENPVVLKVYCFQGIYGEDGYRIILAKSYNKALEMKDKYGNLSYDLAFYSVCDGEKVVNSY